MRGALLALLLVQGCSSPDSDARVSTGPLEVASFVPVSPVLQQSCGTLDCHGHIARNLRTFGYGGLRLSTNDRPDGVQTTADELAATIRSIRALEPTLVNAPPEELTFFRKGTNREHHKGGARLSPSGEQCVYAWLTGGRDDAACALAAAER